MYRNEIEKTQLQRTKSVIWPIYLPNKQKRNRIIQFFENS